MTCQGCHFATDGHTGPDCPMRRIGVKSSFSAGCNLFRNANATLKASRSRQEPGPCPTPARGPERQKAGKPAKRKAPNKTEAEYARILEAKRQAGEIRAILGHESVKIHIGEVRCWYTPDFPVILNSGRLEFHEVKGAHVWDDARVKFQAAKLLYPEFLFVWAQKTKEGWRIE